MKPFFTTPDRLAALRAAASGWLDTPFVPHACIPGAGVDCVNLCKEIYRQAGFLPDLTLPAYTMDGGKHNEQSQLTAWLDRRSDFIRITGEPLTGDLLCFTTGRSAHHTGILLAELRFIHALFSRTVKIGNLNDVSFRRRLTAVYRPLET